MKKGWQDQKVHEQEIITSTIHPYAYFSRLLCTYQSWLTCLLSAVCGRHICAGCSLVVTMVRVYQFDYYWLFLQPSKSKRRDV